MSRLLAFLLSVILLTYILDEPPKMKKAKVNIAPTIGVQEDFYVEIRLDKEEGANTVQCAIDNSERIHKKILEHYPDKTCNWRINRFIIDYVYDHYQNEKKIRSSGDLTE